MNRKLIKKVKYWNLDKNLKFKLKISETWLETLLILNHTNIVLSKIHSVKWSLCMVKERIGAIEKELVEKTRAYKKLTGISTVELVEDLLTDFFKNRCLSNDYIN